MTRAVLMVRPILVLMRAESSRFLRQVLWSASTAVAGFLLASCQTGSDNPDQPSPTPNQVTTGTVASGRESSEVGTAIKGLSARTIRYALRARGLSCRGPSGAEEGRADWGCKDRRGTTKRLVFIYTRGDVAVEGFSATISGPDVSAEDMNEFLGDLAGLRYDGSDEIEARRWLAEAISAGGGDVQLGEVKFDFDAYPRGGGNLSVLHEDAQPFAASRIDWGHVIVSS